MENREFTVNHDLMVLDGVLVQYNGPGGAVTLPEGVRCVGKSAFAGCASLTEITLPASVRQLSVGAFRGCERLSKIRVEEENTCFREEDGLVLSKSGKRVVLCPPGRTGEVSVPEGVEEIGQRAFEGCRWLTRVELPEGLGVVKAYAFRGCAALRELTLPKSLTAVSGTAAFGGCVGLKRLALPEKLTVLGDHAFADSPLEVVTYHGRTLKPETNSLGRGCCALDAPNMAITDFPSAYRPHAARGFAMRVFAGGAFGEGVWEENYRYVRTQRWRLWKDPVVLRLLLRDRLIPKKDLPAYLDAAADLGNPEINAQLLQYRNELFTPEV